MLLNELMKQDDSKEVVENPSYIQFSTKTVRFGDSLYQVKNITGLEVGVIPKQKLQVLLVFGLIIGGIFLIPMMGIGLVPLGIAAWILFSHFAQAQKYGFTLKFNSGGSTSFISKDMMFLKRITSGLYELMEGDIDGLTVNWNDSSVNVVNGEIKGVINTGNRVHVEQNQDNSY